MEKVEVVIVDSSDDDTREIIREFFAERDAPSLTLIEEDERRGLAPALNDAYAATENDMIVKTDWRLETRNRGAPRGRREPRRSRGGRGDRPQRRRSRRQ